MCSRIFDRRAQRFRCTRCRFSARVRVAVEVRAASDVTEPVGVQRSQASVDARQGLGARSHHRRCEAEDV